MPFVAGDINEVFNNKTGTNGTQLVTDAHTFVTNRYYFLAVTGGDNTANGANSTGTPTTTGVTWVELDSTVYSAAKITLYGATVGSDTSSVTTEINFPATQDYMTAVLVDVQNSNDTIVQTVTETWASSSENTIDLLSSLGTDALAIMFISGVSQSRTYTAGAGHTAVTGTSSVGHFSEYNISQTQSMPVTGTLGGKYQSIAVELGFMTTGTTPIITSFNGGDTVANTDTGVTIVGTNFAASGNVVKISPGAVDDALVSTQTITAESATSIDITVLLPIGSTSEDAIFIYVNDGTTESAGFTGSVTPSGTIVLHTMVIEDGSSNPVICESTDFALGMTAYINKGLGNEEIATNITEVSNEDTSYPQLNCTFTAAPINGTDTISVVYDEGVGDIKSVTGSVSLTSSAGTYDSGSSEVC